LANISILCGCMVSLFSWLGCSHYKLTSQPLSEEKVYTTNAIEMLDIVFEAIRRYAWDCTPFSDIDLTTAKYDNPVPTIFPNEKELLMNLLENPDINGWNGPYITESLEIITELLSSEKCVVEKLGNNTLKITLGGYDGELGTKDDVVGEYEFSRGATYTNSSLFIRSDGFTRFRMLNSDI